MLVWREKNEFPPELQEQLKKVPEREHTQIIATYFKRTVSGPFPPPDYLKGYVEVYPPAAKEIFREFRIYGAHRRKREKEEQAFNHKSFQRAQYFSLGIIILLIGGTIIALYLSYPWIAGIMLGFPLLNQIYKMIYGVFRRKEPDNKDSS